MDTLSPIAAEEGTRHVIIGTAGHVDHGKTTLIRALTGTDTDRLAEEKARGMTIDLGFAFLPLPGEPPILAGIVDVPGHEKFVKNMLAGAGGVDVALLVVAADDGPMPQTREHLDILTVLGINRGVVAITKTDAADAELVALIVEATRDALRDTPLRDAPIVPISAQTGEGMDELRAVLARVCAEVPARPHAVPFRLPVDRVFTLPGVGVVVTGTLVCGTLQAGDAVEIQPQGLITRARTLQTHNRKVDVAVPGMRVAVNLPSVDAAVIERGAVLSPPSTLGATTLFDAHLSLLADAPKPLRHRERVRIHLGTGEVLARVLLLTESEIAPGTGSVPAQLLYETATSPSRGERFVVRTYSPARAVGGGVVLDPAPSRKYRRGDPSALALFDARKDQNNAVNHVYAVLASEHRDRTPKEIAAATDGNVADTSALLAALAEEGRAVALRPDLYLSDVAAGRVRETARRTLATYHKQNPFKKVMPRDGLRAPLAKAAALRDFGAGESYLIAENVAVMEGHGLRLPDHVVVMPVGWQKPAEHILGVYEASGFTPPDPTDFQANYPRDVHVPTILNILAENGDLVRLEGNLLLHVSAYESVKETLRRLAQTPEGITVGAVRDATQSSRKIVLPLLEHLDAVRFTRRTGETRVLLEP